MPDNVQPDDELVITLVEQALAQPVEERETYLRGACGASQELFEQAWNYVQWEQRMGRFLLDPIYVLPKEEDAEEAAEEDGFQPGELLENRFRVLREVAQGGMGIVYEAVDEKLDRRIAIKCAKSGFRKRLPPEVRHASDVSHPNVCKIFEIHTARTSSGEVDFVTMEYLDGETLAERLRRGPLPVTEARSIGNQVCLGLQAAHNQGVIHGDLKSGNVILTKSADGATRAAITDFGMARARETSQATVQSGPRGGTPDYMAPELWKGERATFASDVYALGVLLQEIAGTEASAFPKAVVARCLAKEPQDRYPSGSEVVQALRPTHTRRWVLLAAAAAVVVVLTGLVTYQRATAPKEVVRLAMLPFSYDSELAPVADGVFQQTSANLAKLTGGTRAQYSAVSLSQVQRAHVGSPEQANGILGATYVLHGTLTKENDQILLHALLTDTRTGVNVRDWKMDYSPAQMRYLPIALTSLVTGTLHLPPLVYRAINATAQADYDAGTALLRHDATVDEAIAAFERAVAMDPDSALAYAGLAEAQWLKNFAGRKRIWYDRAAESLKQAQRRDMDLPRVLFVSGTLNMMTGRYEQSLTEFTRAIELNPNYSDAYRHLARMYDLNGQHDKALAAYLRAVDVDPEYYRAHLNLGQFYIGRDKYQEALPTLRRAVDLAPREPDARYPLGLALMNLGLFPEAESEMEKGLDLRETPTVLNGLATTLMYQKNERDAIRSLNRAADLNKTYYLAWRNLEICYRRLHRDKESEQASLTGLQLADDAKRLNPGLGYARSFVAYFHARLKHTQLAEGEIEQARKFSPDGSDVLWMAVLTYEALGERQATLDALISASPQLLADLSRWPDLEGLQSDTHFKQLLVSKHAQ